MPTLAGELADILSLRVRDPGNTAHTRDLVLRVLSECQRLVNAETRALLSDASLTVDRDSTIVDIQRLLPSAIRVETIRDGTRDIARCNSWRDLALTDRLWLQRTGGRIQSWCPFTPSLVLLYPAPLTPTVLTIVFTVQTRALTLDVDEIQLPPNLEPAILDLAEQILLLRQRLFLSLQPVAERLPQALEDTSR